MEIIVTNNTGKILRNIRVIERKTLNEMGKAVKINPTHLDQIELGHMIPTKKTLQRVCDHYGLTMQQLTGQQPINWALF